MKTALAARACKKGVKMAVSYKTTQKNKKLDEFEIGNKEEAKDEGENEL